MDAPSSQPEPPSAVFDEKMAESIPASADLSKSDPKHLNIDTHAGVLAASTTHSTRTPDSQVAEEIRSRDYLRTLPPWIQSVDANQDDDDEATATDHLLPNQPNDARVAQHNHAPYENSRRDYLFDGPVDDESPLSRHRESRWKSFSRMIQYPAEAGVEFKEVTPDDLNETMGDYSGPWRGNDLEGDSPEYPLHNNTTRRKIWFKRLHSSLLRSPIVPLILRLTVWCFSLSALALGGSIQHFSDKVHSRQGPSALMAIIVDAVALVYLVYITFDEYTAKPLGLRSPSAKARLILLDLFFIVFDSANLSLAFDSLSEVTGACTEAEVNQTIDPRNDQICVRQKALASVLLVALIAWLMTFAISVLRLVERVRH